MIRVLFLLILLAWAPTCPAQVVYLTTDAGAARFQRAAVGSGSLALFSYVESEARQTFCGPASLAAALNSLGIQRPTPAQLYPYHLLTQDSVFTLENEAVKSYAAVEHNGLTLDELGKFAANLGASVEVVHAQDIAIDVLREKLRSALADTRKRVVVNYSRIPLEQEGDGHISPIDAYDTESYSFLILDVARYKYPPAWVNFDQLYAAMLRIDTSSGKSRGVVILSIAGAGSTQ